MSKTIPSPIGRFSGDVTFITPITYPQLIAWDDACTAARPFTSELDEQGNRYIIDRIRYNHAMLAGVLPCIESHTLKGLPQKLTIDNFPATPIEKASRLAKWLIDEVAEIITGAHDPKDESE